MKRSISLKINAEPRTFDVKHGDTLLDLIRDQAGIKSPKIGCERGDCGSCTVLLDGQSVRSCLVLAVETDGAEVITVEGLCRDGMTPLQEALLEQNAFQCGFCAPGIVLSATELLAGNSNPTETDVKEALSGNLCRCTGYVPIIQAVLSLNDRSEKKD